MPSASELASARAAAGAAYAAAVDALISAYIDLAAFDKLIANELLQAKLPGPNPVKTFGGGDIREALENWLRHPEFKASTTSDLHGQIRAALATKLNTWTGA